MSGGKGDMAGLSVLNLLAPGTSKRESDLSSKRRIKYLEKSNLFALTIYTSVCD